MMRPHRAQRALRPQPPGRPTRRAFVAGAARAAGLALVAPWSMSARPASSEPIGRLLLLHTNDIHDHLRPGLCGLGGLPYLSGYVQQARAERDDVLLVDAGDIVEKGDLAGFLSRGTLTYEALGRMRYDAIVPGNHDHNLARDHPPVGWYELDHLHALNARAGRALLALNLIDRDGSLVLPPSRVLHVNGVRVGIIGLALPRPEGTLDFEQSGRALASEAARLKRQVHVVVVTCHVGVEDASAWSRMARDVDVFVTGHTHETIHEPVVLDDTGAVIVQAGHNARWIGRLELEIDLDRGGVVGHQGGLVSMRHDAAPVDAGMLAWVRAEEERLHPGVGRVVTRLDRPVGWFGIARLAAEALRVAGGSDLGFCHPTHVIRNALPAGPIDVNALFRTAADRGHTLVQTRLSGAEVRAYLNGLAARDYDDWGQTQWAGCAVETRPAEEGGVIYEPQLDPERVYRVTMPEREWAQRLMRLADALRRAGDASPLARREPCAEPVAFSFIDACSAYVRDLEARGIGVHERLRALAEAQGGADPWERRLEPRFEEAVVHAA